jgi:O-methyltransferase involved in polyketide biosynthesis
VCDLWLAGKNDYEADRDLAARVMEAFGPPADGHLPEPQEMFLRGRLFTDRAVSWASRQAGVRQFLDLGAGFPASGRIVVLPDGGTVTLRDTHEAARDGGPARVAYIDNDPVVARHHEALTADGENVVAVLGDLSGPAAVLADPVVSGCLDLSQPVCVILAAVLQYFPPEQATEIAAAYVAAAAPGSVLVVACPRIDDPGLWERVSAAYTAAETWNHTAEQVEGFFDGTDILPPGVVPARGWNAGWRDCVTPDSAVYALAAVGVKP